VIADGKKNAAGQPQFCESGKKNQGFQADGFLAEYAIVKGQFAVKISEKLPLERYVLPSPLPKYLPKPGLSSVTPRDTGLM
jgi:threonine dehydrogenase-like Zn-dependent dehydrogenase